MEVTAADVAAGMLDGVRQMGGVQVRSIPLRGRKELTTAPNFARRPSSQALPLSKATEAWRLRAIWVRTQDLRLSGSSDLPDLSTAALDATLAQWLGPLIELHGCKSKADLQKLDINSAIRNVSPGCAAAVAAGANSTAISSACVLGVMAHVQTRAVDTAGAEQPRILPAPRFL